MIVAEIDGLAKNLYERISTERDRLVKEYLVSIGKDPEQRDDLKEVTYDGNSSKIATYYWQDTPILTIKISESGMAIEFDTPNTETQEVRKET